jgi:hypothetical protein
MLDSLEQSGRCIRLANVREKVSWEEERKRHHCAHWLYLDKTCAKDWVHDHDCHKPETAKGVRNGKRIVRRATLLPMSEPTVMVSPFASRFRREAVQDKVFLMKVNVFVYAGTCFAGNWMSICYRNLR